MATKAKDLALAADHIDSSGNVDANTVDSLDSSQFLRSDANDTTTGRLEINTPNANTLLPLVVTGDDKHIRVGSQTGGKSITMGNTQSTTNGNLDYRGYISYDTYWDNTEYKWRANRTNLGGKWLQQFSYHTGDYKVRYYNGDVTNPWEDSSWSDYLVVKNTGNVGIGTDAPTQKLDVTGTINATGYLQNGEPLEAGAKEDVFYENSQTLSNSYTITSGKSAMSSGPVTLATGVTVTIPSGSRWVIV